MTEIGKIDHGERAVGAITHILSKENFQAFVEIYADELQILEDTLLILAKQKSIDIAVGIWLDYIGKIVGEDRNGLSDVDYRNALRLRIARNTADGTPNSILDLVEQYTESESTKLAEGSIAWFQVYLDGYRNNDKTLWNMVQDIKPAGVKAIVISDWYKNAHHPAWEVSLGLGEVFQVTSDGVDYEDFQVTKSVTTEATEYEDFVVGNPDNTLFSPSTYHANLSWEVSSDYLIVDNDGMKELLLVDNNGVQDSLEISGGTSADSIDETTLCWEIMDTSTSPILQE